jgi:hypothetical protein
MVDYFVNKPYMDDKEFLIAIDEMLLKTQYLRLNIIDKNKNLIKEVTGIATGGSISVNGSSALRRSGSLNMVALIDGEDQNNKITELENIIYMNKMVTIEVGIENTTGFYTEYNIIWYPIGVFIMSNANITKNNSGINLSVTLKDKMSLLNGENGGTFEAPLTHSPMETYEGIKEYPLFTILI